MRIVVGLNKCLGCAQCVPLAPDVLKLRGEEALMTRRFTFGAAKAGNTEEHMRIGYQLINT